jgi:hypothetical protein
VLDSLGLAVFGFDRTLTVPSGVPERVRAGERIRIAGTIDNPLVPGRYLVHCFVARVRREGDYGLHKVPLLDFNVHGSRPGPGNVLVEADVEAVLEVQRTDAASS